MTETKKELKESFFEIKDQAVIARLFDIALRHKLDVTLWLKDQAVKFEATLSYYFRTQKRVSFNLPESITEEGLKQGLAAQGNELIFGSFELHTTPFFFKTEFLSITPGQKFEIKTPKSVFKFQRRANLRITFERHEAPKLTVIDPNLNLKDAKAISEENLLNYRVLDVSAGGIGIVAPKSHKERLKMGMKLKDMRFRIKGIELKADGEIRFIAPTTTDQNEAALRVGIQFTKISSADENHIARVVLEKQPQCLFIDKLMLAPSESST